ncbi:hypothetical protein BKA04_000460 [Cryobacterium mesophilum]|nr:hypothetical protein [Terrimesophilobacter mesophilus]MBB5632237.1 hypothetical protein [Terrimesophilobacter mesophilus]
MTDGKKTPLTMVGQPDAAVCVDDSCEWPPPASSACAPRPVHHYLLWN